MMDGAELEGPSFNDSSVGSLSFPCLKNKEKNLSVAMSRVCERTKSMAGS
jgi:hypothetical protein